MSTHTKLLNYLLYDVLRFGALIFVNFFSVTCTLIDQVPVLKRYPARLSVLSLTCIFGLLQFLAIAIFTEEDLSRWKVHSGVELFTILYAVRSKTPAINVYACATQLLCCAV